MTDRLRSVEVDALLDVVVSLDDPDDMFAFLEDLLTPREIQDLAQRFHVAQLLDSGESYALIQERTGASATTIARVSKALHFGSGGYARVLRDRA